MSDIDLSYHQPKNKPLRNFYALIAFFVLVWVAIFVNVGGTSFQCLIPFNLVVGLFVIAQGIEARSISASRPLSKAIIEQELMWLYGSAWQDTAGAIEYALADERIRRRRLARWQVIIIFGPIYLACLLFMVALISFFTEYLQSRTDVIAVLAVLTLGITLLVLVTVAIVFPTKATVAKRERHFGDSLRVLSDEELLDIYGSEWFDEE